MKKKVYCTKCHEELEFFADILDSYCPECDVPVDEYGREITNKLIYKPDDNDGKR